MIIKHTMKKERRKATASNRDRPKLMRELTDKEVKDRLEKFLDGPKATWLFALFFLTVIISYILVKL